MDTKLRKGIVVIFIANIINVFFSLATNFLLPKYLSVNSYAAIKTFQLYISYIGLLHLGYVDGVYLKYGGKDLSNKLDEEFYTNYHTMMIFQIVITISFALIAIIAKDIILILFVISIFPQNMANYYKFLYQATGEFKLYGNVMNITTISTFVVNMVLLFALGTDNYIYYIALYVIIYFAIWLYLDLYFRTHHNISRGKKFDFKELIQNVKNGILLTLGNLASMFLNGMDRWFIKFLMDAVSFAQYSFAVSIENFLNLAVTPVSTTLYNYFCREKDYKKYRNMLQCIILFSTILPAAAFPAKFILEVFLKNYFDSVKVIFILFAAQMFYIIIKSVYVNLYKVEKKQAIYFRNLLLIIVIGFLFNCICYAISKCMESFAIGTLFSSIVWFIISSHDFKSINLLRNEVIYLIGELIVFLSCGFYMNSILGLLIYTIITLCLSRILMRDASNNIIQNLKMYYSRYKKE